MCTYTHHTHISIDILRLYDFFQEFSWLLLWLVAKQQNITIHIIIITTVAARLCQYIEYCPLICANVFLMPWTCMYVFNHTRINMVHKPHTQQLNYYEPSIGALHSSHQWFAGFFADFVLFSFDCSNRVDWLLLLLFYGNSLLMGNIHKLKRKTAMILALVCLCTFLSIEWWLILSFNRSWSSCWNIYSLDISTLFW